MLIAIPEKNRRVHVCLRGWRHLHVYGCLSAVREDFAPWSVCAFKRRIGHLSCTFFLEAVMGRAAPPLSLFGLLLAVVTALPVRVRKALDSINFSWQMQMRPKGDSKPPFCVWITWLCYIFFISIVSSLSKMLHHSFKMTLQMGNGLKIQTVSRQIWVPVLKFSKSIG